METKAKKKGLLIVGAGCAARHLIETFRQMDTKTPITLLGAEKYRCYDRREIVKIISRNKDVEDCYLDESYWFKLHKVGLYLGNKVVKVDRSNKGCLLGDGRRFSYDKLVIANGSTPNRLGIQGTNLPGVFYFREAQKAIDLKRFMTKRRVRNAVVVGGGPLGIEIIDALITSVERVFLVHNKTYPLDKHLNEKAGNILMRHLKQRGVLLEMNNEVSAIKGNKFVESVECQNGQTLPSDVVVICIGTKSQAPIFDEPEFYSVEGIPVNMQMQTYDPTIYAIGDTASLGRNERKCWQNAINTATVAAHNLANEKFFMSSRLVNSPMQLRMKNMNIVSMGEVDTVNSTSDTDIGQNESYYSRVYSRDDKLIGGVFINSEGKFSEFLQAYYTNKSPNWLKTRI